MGPILGLMMLNRTFLPAVSVALASMIMLTVSDASAQPPPGPAASPEAAPTGNSQAPTPQMEEARQRYTRGLALFSEGNYEAARVEFERAYQLAPSYRILYNIGLAYEQLGDYVQAQASLKRFLELGGEDVTAERRAEVQKELAQIAPRVASAKLILNVEGSEIMVDDICATDKATALVNCGETGGLSREVLLNPGRRRITVKKKGYLPETQVVTVAGSDHVDLHLELKPIPKPGQKEESNPWVIPTIVGWGLTVAGGVTTIAFGSMASSAKDDQLAAVGRFGVTRAELDSLRDDTRSNATISDVALVATGVFAAASGYLTYRALTWKKTEGGDKELNVRVGATSLLVQGRF